MEDGKEMTEEILAQVAALVDGELPTSERTPLESMIAASPELISHQAFLERLREATRAEPLIAMPPGLSERIAAATYARPTLWSRISAALAPAPARYAFTGLALSGAAAICWVALKPSPMALPTPGASPAPNKVAIVDSTPAPALPTPKAVAATPAPFVAAPSQVALAPTPAPLDVPAPSEPVERPAPVASASVPTFTAAHPAPVKHQPGAKPAPKKSLAPAKLVDPLEGQVSVADASEGAMQSTPTGGEISGPTEAAPVAAQPSRSVTSGTAGAAALNGDPSNVEPTSVKPSGAETTKIKLAKSTEGLGSALSAKGMQGASTGSRMSLVSDAANR